MGDTISSVSLLLTIITVIFSLWYSEINNTINMELPSYKSDSGEHKSKVDEVLGLKALPLLVSSALLTLVITPKTVYIIFNSCKLLYFEGFLAFKYYDVVYAIFIIVWLFSLFFTVYIIYLIVKLRGVNSKIEKLQ